MSLYGGITLPGRPDLENVRRLDLLAIPMIRQARRLGMAIDPPHFHELTSKFSAEVAELEHDITNYIPIERLREFSDAGTDAEDEDKDLSGPGVPEASGASVTVTFNASSPEQIGKLLWDVLGIGGDKKLKRTKGGEISTGKKQLELVKLDHPVVPLVLRHRELKTLIKNYTVKIPRLALWHPAGSCCPVCELAHRSGAWRVHGEMGTTRAETGRINHKNPNLGNIPTRTPDGQAVQAGFIAPPGYRLVNRDLSQIELRCLAHLANCKSMIEVYEHDGDIHDDTCHRALGVPWDEKPDKFKHRMAAKRCNFGIQNGTTEKGLYLQLVMDLGTNKEPVPGWLTETWCAGFIEAWLDSRPEVREYFDLQHYRARRYGMVWDAFGRVRLIPEVRSTHSWIKQAGLRQAQNLPVTATAAGQLKLSMGMVEEALTDLRASGMWAWPVLTIHDAIKVECEEEWAEDVLEVLGTAMDGCMDDRESGERMFRVPIKSDGETMERWK